VGAGDGIGADAFGNGDSGDRLGLAGSEGAPSRPGALPDDPSDPTGAAEQAARSSPATTTARRGRGITGAG
jgi:hypothetical protein